MLISLLLTLCAPVPQEGNWTVLPLPSLCEERSSGVHFPALEGGRHLDLEGTSVDLTGSARAQLSPSDVSALMQSAMAGAGRDISFFPYSPPLLADGTDEDLAWARASLEDLDAAGRRNRLVLSAWLIPSVSHAPAGRSLALEGLPDGSRAWRADARPGEGVAFGERERASFIASYEVEVSTDAGVAAPVVGSASIGHTVHLSASRVDGGRQYHLRGLLDLTDLESIDNFKPDTPDLGELHQPILNSVSIAFSGVAKIGESLRVEVAGAPLATSEWSLIVRVDGSAEPDPTPVGQWRAVDVTLLSRQGRNFMSFGPGAGLVGQASLNPLGPIAATISASGVVSAIDTRRRSRSGAGGSPSTRHLGDGLILLSAGDEAGDLALRLPEFVRAVERPRLDSCLVRLESGGLRVSFPVAAGEAARLVIGRESMLLTGYYAEIAPNTWMPSPIIEPIFDGLAWQGRLSAGHVSASAWISTTDEIAMRDRDQTKLGALQLPTRHVRGTQASIGLGEGPAELLVELPSGPGLRMLLEDN